ncbi:eCIS core domain-containing protein [Thalassiella azotivora]
MGTDRRPSHRPAHPSTGPSPRLVRWRSTVNLLTGATAGGLLLARLGRARVEPGPDGLLLACEYAARFPAPRARAVTVGDVVLLRMDVGSARSRPRLLAHERRHAAQWACWLGPVGFLPAYGLASLWSVLRVGDAARANPFEVRAGLADGGYRTEGGTPPPRRRPRVVSRSPRRG